MAELGLAPRNTFCGTCLGLNQIAHDMGKGELLSLQRSHERAVKQLDI